MLFFLLFFYSTWALHTLPIASSLPVAVAYYPSLATRDLDLGAPLKCTDERSRWIIIRSCLLTIFACTWTAIHPNIGAPTDSCWTNLRRRTATMFYALLAPEVMVMWAMKQHIGAGVITENYNRNIMNMETPGFSLRGVIRDFFRTLPTGKRDETQPWTKMHGFLVQMGGLLLVDDNDMPVRVLDYKLLKVLVLCGVIDKPLITKAEIQDKSKGNFIVKGLVFCQTVGFIVQCVARIIQGISLVELEVITLAFAVLNIITYVLWWHKPQNVEVAFRIVGRVPPRAVIYTRAVEEKSQQCITKHVDDSQGTLSNASSETLVPSVSQSIPMVLGGDSADSLTSVVREMLRLSKESAGKGESRRTKSNSERKELFLIRKVKQQHAKTKESGGGAWLWFICAHVPYRLVQSVVHPFSKMAGGENLDEDALHVPMFYAECKVTDWVLSFSSLIAILFGTIHFIAWSSNFPSHFEKIVWRTTAFILVLEPPFFALGNLSRVVKKLGTGSMVKNAVTFVAKVGLPIYIFARLAILMVAFTSLRHLPPSAYEDVSWTAFIPHL